MEERRTAEGNSHRRVMEIIARLEGGTQPENPGFRTETDTGAILAERPYKLPLRRENAKQGQSGKPDSIEERQARLLYIITERKKDAERRALEVFREYQGNIKKAETLQHEIIKGMQAGEELAALFLKAVRVIEAMTGNQAFRIQAERDLLAIYGRGLEQKAPLLIELQEARRRLEKLQAAEQRETGADCLERIKQAIETHKGIISDIENRIA